jgi:hypothetical protein
MLMCSKPIRTSGVINGGWTPPVELAATKLSGQRVPDIAEVNRNIHVVALLIRQLPPWARIDYLPRFNALRWALATEYLLAESGARQNQTAAEISDNAENLIHQINSVPNPTKRGITATTLDRLFKHLKAEARRLQSRAVTLMYREARKRASACLSNPKLDPSVALEGLQPWLKSKNHGREATLLANKLYSLVAERQAGEIMKQFHLAGTQLSGSLLTVAVSTAYNQLAALKISLIARGLLANTVIDADLRECKANLQKITLQQVQKQRKILRAYQVWALRLIKRYAKAQKDFDNQKHWYKLHQGIAGKYYRKVRDAMVSDLLPIHSALLRRGVASLFNQEWVEGWQTLSGREDQTYIAKQSTIVRQLSPQDVWNKEQEQ